MRIRVTKEQYKRRRPAAQVPAFRPEITRTAISSMTLSNDPNAILLKAISKAWS
ncbi:unnamed protein product [marine sediment metagenome]|uniref:Uncharacterized protein n=1 Tax=marine sediment metagenome TaxID=412755 RepID=X0WPD8_9ZZZZ